MATILPFPRPYRLDPTMPEQTCADASPPTDATPDGERWAAWMLLAQDGDRAAYHALLQALTPYVRAITRRYLGRGEDAEDAVQDILMILHGIRHTYERGRPFKPWLSTIASRRCIDLLRRRTHRLRHELTTGYDADDAPHCAHGPEESAVREHETETLHRAVAGLPQRQREAIRLLRLSELSLNEAAAESDQSVGSLKVACHRAIKSLHNALAKKGSAHD
jgi:RNA polymerase sigma-70 factor (ECF subfamily)